MNMAGLPPRVNIKERRFRYLGHILRGSAGKELKDMIETEITQKSEPRGRKRMKWHEIGKSVTGIKEFKTLKENAEDREMEKVPERGQPSFMKRHIEEEEGLTL